jgi:XTP/dITP diphosphohydrolase
MNAPEADGGPLPGRVVLASGNPGKLREIFALAGALGLRPVSQAEFGVRPAPESGATFIENAISKARHAASHTRLPAIADDSGLVVEALCGAPGVHSARYAGPDAADEDNVRKLLAALAGVPPPERGAHFHCVMVYLRDADDPAPVIGEGLWSGSVLEVPRGTDGFGYDPVFYVPSHGCSAAELPLAVKNELSHRGRALRDLCDRLARLGLTPAGATRAGVQATSP